MNLKNIEDKILETTGIIKGFYLHTQMLEVHIELCADKYRILEFSTDDKYEPLQLIDLISRFKFNEILAQDFWIISGG